MTLDSDSDSDHQHFCESVELGIPDWTKKQYDRLDPFVSRLGGQPAWLTSAPTPESTECRVCSLQMYFLLQFDCPVNDSRGNFDRTLYVFACNTKSCVLKSPNDAFKVFVQSKPLNEKPKDTPKVSPNFWEPASLAVEQAPNAITATATTNHSIVSLNENIKTQSEFPVVILKIIDELVKPKPKETFEQPPTSNLDQLNEDDDEYEDDDNEEQLVKEDEFMSTFMERVSHYPRQCVRYSPEFDSQPLHFSQGAFDSLHDFFCSKCKGQMQFWGQLMPAILSLLKVDEHVAHIPEADRRRHVPFGDGLEFATVLIYVCSNCGEAMVQVELEGN